jgi:hypothetical protein
MAPRKSYENTEGIAAEVQNTHTLPKTEKIISHDPLLASAADTQQLGVSSLIYTDINDVYHPLW